MAAWASISLTMSTSLSAIATSIHESTRNASHRHRRRRRRQTPDGPNADGVDGFGLTADADDEPPRDPGRAPRAAFMFLSSVILLGAGRYMIVGLSSHRSNIGGVKSGVDSSGIVMTSSLGSDNTSEPFLISDASQPTTYLGRMVTVPMALMNLADTDSPYRYGDIPFFFHVPRSGGSTIKSIASTCLGLTLASDRGISPGRQVEQILMVLADEKGAKYVNVDTTSPLGIERAKQLGLASFPQLDMIVSNYLHEGAGLFTPMNRGRVFTLLRHPIERACSMYYKMTHDKVMQIELARESISSLESYAKSDLAENNWMTRFLSGKRAGELTVQDEAVAREVMRTKCLVGLLSRKEESMDRFDKFFGLNLGGSDWSERCGEKLIGWGWEGKIEHPEVKEGTTEWKMLWDSNTFDVRIYEYALELFEFQGEMFRKKT